MHKPAQILWIDDEIEVLRGQIVFLESRGYQVSTASDGYKAVELVKSQTFDIIFLDEQMPGISGLEVLNKIKEIAADTPVVMITKSEAEDIMEQAIGRKIADYLIKPVNPNQILLALKKNLDVRYLVSKETTSVYRAEFNQLGQLISQARTFEQWVEVYSKLVYWELQIEKTSEPGLAEILAMQKSEANNAFSRYIKQNYAQWFGDTSQAPQLSPNLMRNVVFPLIDEGKKVFFILIDNLRLDQWRVLQPLIGEYFQITRDEVYCSILPTATQFARNALFAGLMPLEINKMYPQLWTNEDDENTNNFEEELLQKQLQRLRKNYRIHYEKILNYRTGQKVADNVNNLMVNNLVVLVYNFVDMLSHARTEHDMIRELANNEAAYRSVTRTWFEHSHLLELMRELASKDVTLVLTTDHGTTKVENAIKIIGDRTTTTNLRYKEGKSLSYNPREVFEIKDPLKIHLPKSNFNSTYIFASGADYFVYANNYNHYVNYYRSTFQHGGISLEEMLIPFAILSPRK